MIFVTGGTGILGARVIYDLLNSGHQVRALKRPHSELDMFQSVFEFYRNDDSSDPAGTLEWIDGDILDQQSISDALIGVRVCIHCAAMVSFHSRDRDGMYKVNVDGTSNVVNLCMEKSVRLIHISSVAAIGRTQNSGKIDESLQWKDSPYNSGYALSKYRSELEVWRGIEEGLDAVILNPSIILGAGSSARSSGSIFGVVRRGLAFYTTGSTTVVDVRDVSSVILKSLDSEVNSERYILNSATVPFKELFSVIADKMEKKRPSIKVRSFWLQLAWRVLVIKDLLFRTKSNFTKESAVSAQTRYEYDNSKAKAEFEMDFKEWEDSVTEMAPFYSD